MKLNLLKPTAIALLSLFAITSCVKDDDYDIPNPNGEKTLPSFSGQVVGFDTAIGKAATNVTTYGADEAIEGYVISSDEAGNFYQKIYIQNEDKTKGVTVAINKTGLYTDFPLGAKVQLRLKGLTSQINNGGVDFGSGIFQANNGRTSVGRMSEAIAKNHLFDKGGVRKTLAELAKADTSINTLKVEANVNQLITLKGVHFKTADVGKEMHQKTNDARQGTDYTLTDAQGNTIPFRTSRYAKFKDEKVPAGTLDITGVLTKFGQNWQFMISNYADIVVVNGGTSTGTQTNTQTSTTVETVEASTATAANFVEGKKVKLHGNLTVEGTKAYILFSDGTKIQLYTRNFKNISNENKTNLKENGKEVTVTGTFGKFNDTLQISYEQDSDLVWGASNNNPNPPATVETVEASTATAASFVEGKKVKLHGNLTVEGTKSYIVFSDGTKIQIYIKNFKNLSKESKDNLKINGKEVTVTGTFSKHNTTLQIAYEQDSDLVWGASNNNPNPQPPATVTELDASTATAADFQLNKVVKLTGNITIKNGRSAIVFTTDNTEIQLTTKGYNNLPDDFKTKISTEGKKVIVKGTFTQFKDNKKNTVTKQLKYDSIDDVQFP
jgi:nucleic acid-binding domain protein